MTDHFAALGQQHSLTFDADALKEEFQKRSAEHHPDVAGNESSQFSELNKAHQILSDPASRIRHFIDLEFPDYEYSGQSQPAKELADLWFKTGEINQQFKSLAQKKSAASSAIAKAMLAGEETILQEACEEHIGKLSEGLMAYETMLTELQPPFDPQQLHTIADSITFLNRWKSQLQEALLQIILG